MKDAMGVIVFIILVGALICVAFIGGTQEAKASIAAYNNGICTECGGEYRLCGAYYVRNSGDHYIYVCQECGHGIETCDIMN